MTQTWSLRPGCIGESIPAPDGVSTHRIGNVTPTLRARPELVEGSAPCGSGVPAAFVASISDRRLEFYTLAGARHEERCRLQPPPSLALRPLLNQEGS